MEERALYRAILDQPHDDTARLVYADWLDENAERFPAALARAERARAEFVRVQCALARRAPGGWNVDPEVPPDPELAERQKRLLFRCGAKWRRGFPLAIRTARIDRGFLRPRRGMRPQEFLRGLPPADAPPHLALPADSPLRRYVPDGDPFAVCPLWDVHLYASDFHNDPLADRGQYGELLAEVARSPALARVGWLKVSFFHTQVYSFLRAGNFANVETLVLNARPFPGALEAVAGNESFRSLRYVRLGDDRWAWGGSAAAARRYAALAPKLEEANAKHLPHGEMRGVLRALLHGLPVAVRMGREPSFTLPSRPPPAAAGEGPGGSGRTSFAPMLGALVAVALLVYVLAAAGRAPRSGPPAHKFEYDPDPVKVPPAVREWDKWNVPPTKR